MDVGTPEAQEASMKRFYDKHVAPHTKRLNMLKWEQTFVAYSDCGKYKIEVDYDQDEPGFPWCWDIWDTSTLEYIQNSDCDYDNADEAKLEAAQALERILAEDKQREANRPQSPDEANRALMDHIMDHVRAYGITYDAAAVQKLLIEGDASGFTDKPAPRCRFCNGTGVHDCRGGMDYEAVGGMRYITAGLVDASAFPAELDQYGERKCLCSGYCITGHCSCFDQPASTGDFWAPPRDVREDEFSCPVLEENVQEKIDPKQFSDMRPLIAEGKSLAGRWDLAKALIAAPGVVYSKEDMDELLTPPQKKSGYDQILAAIKNESKDIEL